MSGHALTPHPETERLMGENALLREELTGLLAEMENLAQAEKPYLLALYQTRVGLWEMRLLQAQCETARLRREVEVIQASLNRGEAPDLREIEGQLELELLTWQQKLREAADRLEAAERCLKNLLSPEEAQEFRALYRSIVKHLHPDVNPDLTDEQKRLWQRVQAAYAAGDLVELQALALLVEKPADAAAPPTSLERLRQDQAALRRHIAEMLKRIEAVESQPPFTLRKNLEDETWLAGRRGEIEAQIEQLRPQRDALAAHRQALLDGRNDGTTFGKN